MRGLLGPNYRNLTALVAVAAVLAIGYLLVPHPLVQYGAWLIAFAVWMAWFVTVARDWISRADF